MLSFAGLVLAGLALGLGNLSTAIRIFRLVVAGRAGRPVLLWQGWLQAIFPVLGFILGMGSSVPVGNAKWVAVAVLVLSGLQQVVLTKDLLIGRASERAERERSSLKTVVLSSFLRNVAIGFGLVLLSAPLMLAAGIIATAGVFVSLAGTELWRGLGRRVEVGIGVASAISLVLLAIAIV